MSFEYNSSEFSESGIQELSFEEVEKVNGGAAPLVPLIVAVGAGSGAAIALFNEITDEREGINPGNVLIGAAAGAGAAVSPFVAGASVGVVGTFAGGVGTTFFGYLGAKSIQANTNLSSSGPTVTVGAGCGGNGPCYDLV